MLVVFRWMLRIFLGLAGLVLLAVPLAYYFATQSIPDYSADYQVDGLDGPVEIVRDNHNVPHIFAGEDADVYFGLGFAHAQDRLWQMMMMRRTAQGRLSELFGTETVEIDEFIRRLDIYNLAAGSLQYQTNDAKRALNSYAAGVNEWLRIVQRDALGRGAPEYFLFTPQIAPWTATDSLAITRILSLQISSQLQEEVLRARTALTIENDRLLDILPDDPNQPVVALPDFASLFENLPQPTDYAAAPHHPLDPRNPIGFASASNAWAAMPERTARGAPLLATDPHLGLSAPSIWMLARMEFSDGGVIGGTIPGMPAIIAGRSNDLAWGLTTAYVDDLDVYMEQLNPDNPNEYLTPDGYKPFRTKRVIVEVKNAPSVTLDMKWTENGPVIGGGTYNLKSVTPAGHVASVNWTALRPEDTSLSAAVSLMRAKSVTDARLAVKQHFAPAQNIIMADKSSIALQTIGKIPRRDPNHVSKGRLPSQGWLPRNRWQGDFPFSANPYRRDPSSGVVANTNNRLTDDPFPRHVGFDWGDTQRIQRLTRLLNNRKIHTRDSFMEAQLDPVSFTARALLPLVAKELWFKDAPAETGSKEQQRQIALELLAEWNGEMDQHVPEPLIYAAWMRQLQRRLIVDELGSLADEFTQVEPIFIERVFRDVDGAAAWCDIRPSSKIETCEEMARIALDAALIELTEKYGNRIDSWRWGQAHQAQHDHEVLGKIPLLSWFVNIRQDTPGGDNTLQRAKTASKGATPYANIHAAGFRALVDFADLESSLYIISTGQSGHFLSRHYDDLAQIWRRGEYIPMTLDPQLARSGAVGITNLTPNAN